MLAAVLAVTAAPKPEILAAPLVAAAPAVAPAIVTATSSQVIARNFNTLAAPIVQAPLLRSAPIITAPLRAPLIQGPAAAYFANPALGPAGYYASPYRAPLII